MHALTRIAHTAPRPLIVPEPGSGIVTSTAICAGGTDIQHAEGIVVSTAISGGGTDLQHAEGIVVSTAITAGGLQGNHAEAIGIATAGPPRLPRT